jgi:DNA invertase Pin-like site-specific DNA recombinase
MGATVVDIQRLVQCGVAFHSFTEEHLCTDNKRACGVLLPVIHPLAKLERQKISERTRAGLERARAKGKRLGRAPFSSHSAKSCGVRSIRERTGIGSWEAG